MLDLRSKSRDYRGINDEIYKMENRYRMMHDDKARGEHEARTRLDKTCDEITEARRVLDDLKYQIQEKTKLNACLSDDIVRTRQ